MSKPRLPAKIETIFSNEILGHIYRYVPKTPNRPKTHPGGLQRELERLQKSPKQTAMGLYGYDDFVLY